jgi:acetate kinase
MGTRAGDMDPSLPLFLLDRGMEPEAINATLNKKSGLLGLSGGLSNDMRTLLEKESEHPGAKLAVDTFCYRLKKYIGSYIAALGGLDALVFTGGIGENADVVRARTCAGLEWLGLELDPERNARGNRKEACISKDGSRARIYVIPTDEERVIGRETARLTAGKKKTVAAV